MLRRNEEDGRVLLRSICAVALKGPAVAFAVLWVAASSASTSTSQILTLRSHASTEVPGNLRVSVQMTGATSCPFSGWYSFDLPDSLTAKTWVSILLSAQASGRQVTIAGTGTCDSSGLERISYMDSLP